MDWGNEGRKYSLVRDFKAKENEDMNEALLSAQTFRNCILPTIGFALTNTGYETMHER